MPNEYAVKFTREELNAVNDAVEMRVKGLEEAVIEGTADEDDKDELALLNTALTKF
jgi:hypothetical protein